MKFFQFLSQYLADKTIDPSGILTSLLMSQSMKSSQNQLLGAIGLYSLGHFSLMHLREIEMFFDRFICYILQLLSCHFLDHRMIKLLIFIGMNILAYQLFKFSALYFVFGLYTLRKLLNYLGIKLKYSGYIVFLFFLCFICLLLLELFFNQTILMSYSALIIKGFIYLVIILLIEVLASFSIYSSFKFTYFIFSMITIISFYWNSVQVLSLFGFVLGFISFRFFKYILLPIMSLSYLFYLFNLMKWSQFLILFLSSVMNQVFKTLIYYGLKFHLIRVNEIPFMNIVLIMTLIFAISYLALSYRSNRTQT
jgi:hypothetical protein